MKVKQLCQHVQSESKLSKRDTNTQERVYDKNCEKQEELKKKKKNYMYIHIYEKRRTTTDYIRRKNRIFHTIKDTNKIHRKKYVFIYICIYI